MTNANSRQQETFFFITIIFSSLFFYLFLFFFWHQSVLDQIKNSKFKELNLLPDCMSWDPVCLEVCSCCSKARRSFIIYFGNNITYITIRSVLGQREHFYCLYNTECCSIPIATCGTGNNSGTRPGRSRYEIEVRTVHNQPKVILQLLS